MTTLAEPRAPATLARLGTALRRNKMASFGAGIVILMALSAIFAPVLSPHDPLEQDVLLRLAGPSAEFPLGNDSFGRDVLSRILLGGRVSLYVGRWACDIEGLPQDEGRALIAYLQEFARQDRFVYRHRWRDGDAVLWDNRCTQHCATPFDETRYTRLMHRTTLEGTAPIMA